MNLRKRDTLVKELVADIGSDYRNYGIRPALALLTSFIGRVAAEIPDGEWMNIVRAAAEPCGIDGCECHIVAGPLLNAVSDFRECVEAERKALLKAETEAAP